MKEWRVGLGIVSAGILIALAIVLAEVWWMLTPVLALAGGLLFGYSLRQWWEHAKQEWEGPGAAVQQQVKPRVAPEDDPNWWGYTHKDEP